MRIGIDIDDTISKTWEVLFPNFLEYFHLTEKSLNKNAKNYSELLGVGKEEYYEYMFQNFSSFVSKAEVKTNCREVLKRLKERKIEIILITVRAENMFENPERNTKDWLTKMDIPYDKLFCGVKDKFQICKEEGIDIFIDDNVDHCIAVSTLGIPVFLMDSIVNQYDKSLQRVYNWLEVEELLRELE